MHSQVLEVAVDLVSQQGLTVGLGHLSFDEIIQKAGVSRTTAYRVWPRKERFLEDLLRSLADVVSPYYGDWANDIGEKTFDMLKANLSELATAEGRWAMMVEACRVAVNEWAVSVASTPTWKTFLALITTMRSLADQELADELRRRLRVADQRGADKIERLYQHAWRLLGFRPRGVTAKDVVYLGALSLEGAMLQSETLPEVFEPLGMIDPFATGRVAEWTLNSIAYASAICCTLEPDPNYDLVAVVSLLG